MLSGILHPTILPACKKNGAYKIKKPLTFCGFFIYFLSAN